VTWPLGIIIFLAIITLASYFITRRSSSENFTPVYLSSITGKLLLSCVFVIIFIKADKGAADYNTVFFLIAYVIFTAAEVIFLFLKKRP
jgi:K+ transporter